MPSFLDKANTWSFTQNIIRIGHNRDVKKYFKDVKTNEGKSTGREAIKTALLIKNSDSALEVLNKQLFFRLGMQGSQAEAIATVPEKWQVVAAANRPQLVIAYKIPGKKTTYSITVPHYKGGKNPKFTSYQKGNYRGCLVLSDNSKIVVYAISKAEAESTINQLKKYVSTKYLKNVKPISFTEVQGIYNKVTVYPYFADYYPNGIENIREWRSYF